MNGAEGAGVEEQLGGGGGGGMALEFTLFCSFCFCCCFCCCCLWCGPGNKNWGELERMLAEVADEREEMEMMKTDGTAAAAD